MFPTLIREQNPGITDEQVEERRKHLVAVPSNDPSKPSPHATGGLLDLSLRFRADSLNYMEGTALDFGHTDGDTSIRANPDYNEQNQPRNDQEQIAQRNRRAFHAIMTGAAFGVETELICNPTEWWHWGRGDQLSEQVRGGECAYYSLAEP